MGYGMMGHMFGNGYGSNVNWWWLLGFGLLRLLLIIGGIVLVVRMFRGYHQPNTPSKAVAILQERYAAGEINEDDYKRKLKLLK